MSIRAQLALLAALIAGPLIALLAFQTYREFEADRAAAGEGVQRVARAAAIDARRTLDETERVLKRLADRAAVRAMSPSQCDPAIEDFRAAVSGLANILTVNRHGEVVCSAIQARNFERSIAKLEWVRRAQEAGALHVSSPTASVVTGEPVVYVSLPLEAGFIAAALGISSFEPVSEEDHAFAEDTVISIVDADGFMVARSTDARAWVGKNVRGQGVVDIALSRKSGYVIAPGLMGIERVFGFAAVPGVPWVAYAGVRSDAVFAHARSVAWQNAGLAGLVILVTAFLVALMSERIGAPIRTIARTARAVADGRLDVRAPAAAGRELAAVSTEFNRMLDQRVESERLLQQVIDTVPAIIHVKDLEGRYRLVNREFERVTGVRDAVGKRDSQMFPPELVEIVTAHDRAALERPGTLLVEESVNGRHYIVGKAAMRDADGSARYLCTAAFNITERKELEERQRRLSRRVFEVAEDERLRLSRELHDRIGQPLAALRMNLDVLRTRFPDEAKSELDRQAMLVDELIRLVRSLTAELRPPELEHVGLAAALRNYAEQAAARYGFAVDVLGAEFSPRLPRAAERALFRIAQEALANAAKHAKAETVTIELDVADGEALVCVADDGRGFNATSSRVGFGLHTMRERAEEVGGRLEVESAEGRGTRVIAAVPRAR